MSSLYLGKIGSRSYGYEVHAFTKDLPFRRFSRSAIADQALYDKLLSGRYKVLEEERPIYCTAVTPNTEKKIEENPHDSREGTVHVVTMDKSGDIICAASVAVDTGEKENGKLIGVPLENRWKPGDFPEGSLLDDFRTKYHRLNHGVEQDIRPWEMAEVYRHFKKDVSYNTIGARLAVYIGIYHLLVRDPMHNNMQPTDIFVFDAIPRYFDLYKIATAAVLRDKVIDEKPVWLSPIFKKIKTKANKLYYKSELISRDVETPIPYMEDGELKFKNEDVPFLDGFVDFKEFEKNILEHNFSLRNRPNDFSFVEMLKLRLAVTVLGKRYFQDDAKIVHHLLYELLSTFALNAFKCSYWSFNEIGEDRLIKK